MLHVVCTIAALVWVYRRHRTQFALLRTVLVAASGLALIVYIVYPTAPPRLARLGFVDTVTAHAGVNLNSELLGQLYNPIAAVPNPLRVRVDRRRRRGGAGAQPHRADARGPSTRR